MRFSADRPLRLLPLGDSITRGSPDKPGGYRLELERRLSEAGWCFEFVGRQHANSEGMRHPWHEGHPGFRIEDLRLGHANAYSSCGTIEATVADAKPDGVLLLVGTNNLYFDDPVSAVAEMERLWDGLMRTTNGLNLFVGTLTTILPGPKSWGHVIPEDVGARVELFNALLGERAESWRRRGHAVHRVDVASAVTGADDFLEDGVHPSPGAMVKIAERWLMALDAIYGW